MSFKKLIVSSIETGNPDVIFHEKRMPPEIEEMKKEIERLKDEVIILRECIAQNLYELNKLKDELIG